MIKLAAIGAWAVVVALASSYATAMWTSGGSVAIERPATKPEGLEYRRPAPITVPMISDGKLDGYVVARIVFTASASALRELPIDPQAFVIDEAFRRIYTDGRVEFDQMSKYNLDEITDAIKANVNQRLGFDLVEDVLIDELNYVNKDDLKSGGEAAAE